MIQPMTTAYAETISAWTYPNENAVYSFSRDAETVAELMNGDYYAYTDPAGNLTGYFCFGHSARIPAVEADAYTDNMLDIGLGLRPDLCGKGLGRAFVQSGLEFANDTFHAGNIRLTVAAFNRRAIRVYESLGFRRTAQITHRISGKPFQVMTRVFP